MISNFILNLNIFLNYNNMKKYFKVLYINNTNI